MQVIPHYCSQCNRKIASRDLETGKAFSYKEHFFCQICIKKHPTLQKLKDRADHKKSLEEDPPPSRHTSNRLAQFGPSPGSSTTITSLRALPLEDPKPVIPPVFWVLLIGLILSSVFLWNQLPGRGAGKDKDGPSPSALEKALLVLKKQLKDLSGKIDEGHSLEETLRELKKIEKPLEGTELFSEFKDLLKRGQEKLARKKFDELKKKIQILVEQENFDGALEKLRAFLVPVEHNFLDSSATPLKKKILLYKRAKEEYLKTRAKAREALKKSDFKQAISLYTSYPSQYSSTPWARLVDHQLKNLYKDLEKWEEKQKRNQEAQEAYLAREKGIQSLLSRGKYWGALDYSKKIPTELEGTLWEKKLKEWGPKILKLRRQAVYGGTIHPPSTFATLLDSSSVGGWKKRGGMALRVSGEIIRLENDSSREGYVFLGNSQWQDYALYFLVRLRKGEGNVFLRTDGKSQKNGTLLAFPSSWQREPERWHECLIVVQGETLEFYITDGDLDKPYKTVATTTSQGMIGFGLSSHSLMEIKNLRIRVTKSLQDYSTFVNLLEKQNLSLHWISSSSGGWQWQGKNLVGTNRETKPLLLFTRSGQWKNFILLLRVRASQGSFGLLVRANPERNSLGVSLPFVELSSPGKWETWKILIQEKTILVQNQEQSTETRYSLSVLSEGKIGIFLLPGSRIQFSQISVKAVK